MKVTRTTGGISYETNADVGIRWHPGCKVIRDHDGTSTNSRHHPVFCEIGGGWMWLQDYTTTRAWWLHESGLHFVARFHANDAANPFDNPTLYPALAAAIRQAVADGVTGFCAIDCCDGTVKISKWSNQ